MILSMELLSNLLEANNDDNIYKFLVKLDIKIMRLKLLQEYITYVTTILELDVKATAAQINSKLDKMDEYEGNIESAFNLYFLLI